MTDTGDKLGGPSDCTDSGGAPHESPVSFDSQMVGVGGSGYLLICPQSKTWMEDLPPGSPPELRDLFQALDKGDLMLWREIATRKRWVTTKDGQRYCIDSPEPGQQKRGRRRG